MITATEPAPAQNATTEATPAAATQASTLDPGLAEALAARAQELSGGGRSKVEEKPAEEAEAAKDDKPTEGEKPAETEAAKPATEEDKPETPAKDAVADELAQFARARQETGRLKADAAKRAADLDAREKALAAKSDLLARAEALEAAKADPLKAIELLLGPDALTGNLPFQLIDAAVAKQSGKPEPTPEEREAALIAKAKAEALKELEAKQAEAAKKQQEQAAAAEEEKKAHFCVQLDQFAKAHADKYVFVASEGFDAPDAIAFVQQFHGANGRMPTGDEILSHFEKALEAKATRYQSLLNKRSPPPVPPKADPPAATPTAKPAVDTRGKAPVPKKVTSYEEDREARAANLR